MILVESPLSIERDLKKVGAWYHAEYGVAESGGDVTGWTDRAGALPLTAIAFGAQPRVGVYSSRGRAGIQMWREASYSSRFYSANYVGGHILEGSKGHLIAVFLASSYVIGYIGGQMSITIPPPEEPIPLGAVRMSVTNAGEINLNRYSEPEAANTVRYTSGLGLSLNKPHVVNWKADGTNWSLTVNGQSQALSGSLGSTNVFWSNISDVGTRLNLGNWPAGKGISLPVGLDGALFEIIFIEDYNLHPTVEAALIRKLMTYWGA